MNETHGTVTLVAQRTREALGEVSLFMYAQNLEAQMGLDYMCSPQVRLCLIYDSHFSALSFENCSDVRLA